MLVLHIKTFIKLNYATLNEIARWIGNVLKWNAQFFFVFSHSCKFDSTLLRIIFGSNRHNFIFQVFVAIFFSLFVNSFAWAGLHDFLRLRAMNVFLLFGFDCEIAHHIQTSRLYWLYWFSFIMMWPVPFFPRSLYIDVAHLVGKCVGLANIYGRYIWISKPNAFSKM